MKRLIAAVLTAWACNAGAAWAAEALAPEVLARTVTDEVLAIVRADRDLQAGDQRKMLELVEAKVAPHFSFIRMVQLAMGRNWRDATAQQQKRLVEEFRTLLVRSYTSAFTQYRNQAVEYRRPRMAVGDTDVVVQSLIRPSGGQPLAVDYSMEKTDNGWKVYNVKIEGVSLVENYRGTFNTEIQKHGIDGLIKSLAERNRVLVQAQGR